MGILKILILKRMQQLSRRTFPNVNRFLQDVVFGRRRKTIDLHQLKKEKYQSLMEITVNIINR